MASCNAWPTWRPHWPTSSATTDMPEGLVINCFNIRQSSMATPAELTINTRPATPLQAAVLATARMPEAASAYPESQSDRNTPFYSSGKQSAPASPMASHIKRNESLRRQYAPNQAASAVYPRNYGYFRALVRIQFLCLVADLVLSTFSERAKHNFYIVVALFGCA